MRRTEDSCNAQVGVSVSESFFNVGPKKI
jgi:hypothetical protein